MFLPSSFPSSSSALLASLASMMMRRAAHRWGLVDEPFILALAALLLLPVAAAPADRPETRNKGPRMALFHNGRATMVLSRMPV